MNPNGLVGTLVLLLAFGQFVHSQNPVARRDGEHDFDFEIGVWKTHLSLLQHPLTGSTNWVQYDGTSVVRKLGKNGANLVELEAAGRRVIWKLCRFVSTTQIPSVEPQFCQSRWRRHEPARQSANSRTGAVSFSIRRRSMGEPFWFDLLSPTSARIRAILNRLFPMTTAPRGIELDHHRHQGKRSGRAQLNPLKFARFGYPCVRARP